MDVRLYKRNTEIHASKGERILMDMFEVNFKFDITEVTVNDTFSKLWPCIIWYIEALFWKWRQKVHSIIIMKLLNVTAHKTAICTAEVNLPWKWGQYILQPVSTNRPTWLITPQNVLKFRVWLQYINGKIDHNMVTFFVTSCRNIIFFFAVSEASCKLEAR